MGDTFFIKRAIFCGYAVEDSIGSWGAVASDPDHAPETKVCLGIEPSFWRQSQDRLQMEGAFFAGWAPGVAQSQPPSAAAAAPVGGPLDSADPPVAAATSALGSQENAGVFSTARLVAAEPAHNSALVATVAFEPAPASAPAPCLRVPAATVDGGTPPQPGLDGGFQGLVPGGQWRAVRTVDGARSVQSLWFGGACAAHAAWPAGQGRLYKAVSASRPAGRAADGQWPSVCFARPGGAFAAECLVGAAGHPGGVFPARLSARQWRARTVSWGDATGNRRAPRRNAPGTTASHHLLAAPLQPPPTARGAGSRRARQAVSQESPEISAPVARTAIRTGLHRAPGAQQRRNPLGGPQAVYWRGLCGAVHWSAPNQARDLWGPVRAFAHRASARTGNGSHAPGTLSAWSSPQQKSKSVTYVLASKCHPCVGTVPTPALSLGERGNGPPVYWNSTIHVFGKFTVQVGKRQIIFD